MIKQMKKIGNATLYCADCKDVLPLLKDIDACVTDPPYGLSFMGKRWDYDVPGVEVWTQVNEVLKPGSHLLSFFGSRTYHRGAIPIEDAGFEIRDQLMWLYGSGFPKSHNIGKKIEQYEGWGTALKPAHEPIVMARKPFKGTVANNVLEHGTGGINIDDCRVETDDNLSGGSGRIGGFAGKTQGGELSDYKVLGNEQGRFPANVMHDGSDGVQDIFGDKSRYFYCAKASKKDRDEGLDMIDEKPMAWSNQAKAELERGNLEFRNADGNTAKHNKVQMRKNSHPTVKPTELMRYLCRLVTPKGGVVLDPFMGSGSTGKAAIEEDFNFVGIEMDEDYFEIACARIEAAHKQKSQELKGLF